MSRTASIWPRSIAVAALLAFGMFAPLLAQTPKKDRNKAQPYFDPPRQTLVTSVAAINSWAGALLKGVQKPAALVYGNAQLTIGELSAEQSAQIDEAEGFVLAGVGQDKWMEAKFVEKRGDKVPVIKLFPDAAPGDHPYAHPWLDITEARKAVARLADALKKHYSSKADEISANAKTYDQQLADLDKWADGMLKPFSGTSVILERPGAELFLGHYGISVAGVFQQQLGTDITAADVARIRKLAASMEHPVFIRRPGQLPVAIIRLSQELPIRFVMLDPMESGDASPERYVEQMRRNTIQLALGLRTAKEIAAAYTPAPPGSVKSDEAAVVMPQDANQGEDAPTPDDASAP